MSVKVKLPITYCSCDNYLYIKYPSYVLWEISRETFNKIIKVNKLLKENKWFMVYGDFYNDLSFYDSEIDLNEENDSEKGMDYNHIIVTENVLYVSAHLTEGEDTNIESEGIGIETIEKYLKISELPIEEIPLYINDKDENIRNLVKERLERKE